MLKVELEQEAKKYSRALLEFAEENGKAIILDNDINNLQKLLSNVNQNNLIQSLNRLNLQKQVSFFSNLLTNINANVSLHSFCKLMLHQNKLVVLLYFIHNYLQLKAIYNNHIPVVVTSAISLNDNFKERVTNMINNKIKEKYYVNYVVNPSILGGLIININGKNFDDSLQLKLTEIAKNFVNK